MSLINKGESIYKASRKTGVPESTLRNRKLGRISVSTVKSGPTTLFSKDEESLSSELDYVVPALLRTRVCRCRRKTTRAITS